MLTPFGDVKPKVGDAFDPNPTQVGPISKIAEVISENHSAANGTTYTVKDESGRIREISQNQTASPSTVWATPRG